MNTNFGVRIKMLRLSKKMTQTDLAKRLGVTKSMISSYESDTRKPSPDVLAEIGVVFGVSMDFIFDNNSGPSGDGALLDITNLLPDQIAVMFTIVNEFTERNMLEKLIQEKGIKKNWMGDEELSRGISSFDERDYEENEE